MEAASSTAGGGPGRTVVAGLGPEVLQQTKTPRRRMGQLIRSAGGAVVGAYSIQGYRDHMEDAVCAVSELEGFPGVLFLGVFDGHGGDFASDFASKNLLPVLLEDTEKLRKALEDPEGNAGFFKSGFLACDRKLRSEVESITGETSGRKGIRRAGCTAVTCFVTPSHVIVANAGDSRCILTRDGNVFQMNIEHTPMDPREAKRVYEAGSFISQRGRVGDRLNLSRGLGDHSLKDNLELPLSQQAISPEPDVHVLPRNGHEEFLVLGSDGLFDGLTNERCAGLLAEGASCGTSVQALAEALTDEALKRGSTDNITALVLAFTKTTGVPAAQPSQAGSGAVSMSSSAAVGGAGMPSSGSGQPPLFR